STGTVQVSSGSLELASGGSNTNVYNVDPGAAMYFTGGTFTMSNGAQLNGLGTYELDGGQLTVNTAVSISTFNQGGGSLAGSGTVTITAALSWTGGDEYGTGITGGFGSTVVAGSATLSISGSNSKN